MYSNQNIIKRAISFFLLFTLIFGNVSAAKVISSISLDETRNEQNKDLNQNNIEINNDDILKKENNYIESKKISNFKKEKLERKQNNIVEDETIEQEENNEETNANTQNQNCVKITDCENPEFETLTSTSFFPRSSANYVYSGKEKIIKIVNGEKTFYHNNYANSIDFTTDQFGNINQEFIQLPFGSDILGKGEFHGKKSDQSGLLYYGARYYDPITGRFTQPDPIQRDSENPYWYANGNPLSYIDPDGNSPVVIGATIGLLTEASKFIIKNYDKIVSIRSIDDVKALGAEAKKLPITTGAGALTGHLVKTFSASSAVAASGAKTIGGAAMAFRVVSAVGLLVSLPFIFFDMGTSTTNQNSLVSAYIDANPGATQEGGILADFMDSYKSRGEYVSQGTKNWGKTVETMYNIIIAHEEAKLANEESKNTITEEAEKFKARNKKKRGK